MIDELRLPRLHRFSRPTAGLALLVALCGCGSHATPSLGGGTLALPTSPQIVPASLGRGKITHVVVIVQENRSFDDVFYGYPGADTATAGTRSDGTTVPLALGSFDDDFDIAHNLNEFVESYDGGKMDGFDREQVGGIGGNTPLPPGVTVPPNAQYSYLDPAQTKPYFTLASQYVLADRFFPSQVDESFTSHQFLIAAQSGNTVDAPDAMPWGCDAKAGTTVPTLNADRSEGGGVFPCFTYRTLGDELDAANLSWRYYAPSVGGPDVAGKVWSAYDAIRGIRYGPDWTRSVISPETTVLSDVAAGTLASVSWVIPDFANSDHPQSQSASGPQWVTSIVNAVGASRYWNSTAIIVFWDDWGGFYDHVVPPQLSAQSLGLRTPMLVISPFAKTGYVSHVQYETGSIDRFIEGVFGLSTLADADYRATDLDDCFDFSRASRPFAPFAVRRSPSSFIHETPSNLPPDSD